MPEEDRAATMAVRDTSRHLRRAGGAVTNGDANGEPAVARAGSRRRFWTPLPLRPSRNPPMAIRCDLGSRKVAPRELPTASYLRIEQWELEPGGVNSLVDHIARARRTGPSRCSQDASTSQEGNAGCRSRWHLCTAYRPAPAHRRTRSGRTPRTQRSSERSGSRASSCSWPTSSQQDPRRRNLLARNHCCKGMSG
jgi:hypothetical protein